MPRSWLRLKSGGSDIAQRYPNANSLRISLQGLIRFSENKFHKALP